ncbi:TPA_asm: N [Scutellaria alphacytorhabdovirus 1]|nr:TPA_asm: N [Scutellaria alphacytorhabdovirus 1]
MMDSSDKAARLEQIRQKAAATKKNNKTITSSKNTKYDDLDGVIVTLTNAPKVWDDSELANIKTYDVEKLSPADILQHGKSVFKRIEMDQFTTSDVETLLALAVSIMEPGCSMINPIYMLEKPDDSKGNKYKKINVEANASTAETNLEKAQNLERLRGKHSAAKTDAEKKRLESVMKKLEKTIASAGSSTDVPVEVADGDDFLVYPYLAAYILRLYGKTPEAWCDRLELAKKRAATWYNISGGITESFVISVKQATFIRESMARKPEICSTWVLWCSYTENNPSQLSSTSAGIIKYLATQMYAYTGMHAYSFIVQIQSETGVSFKTLLSELDCPATRSAVREVADVIRNYEVTALHPKRTTYFRYARVWDPGYFSSIQTSNCKTLAYVVAKVRKSIAGGMSSPTDIFALKGLDDKFIATLDDVADNLYDIIIESTTQDAESGSIWKKK